MRHSKFHVSKPVKVVYCILVTLELSLSPLKSKAENNIPDVRTFVNNETYAKPQFDKNDEKFVREFGKSLGVEFNQNMELPSCMWRTRLSVPGGFVDGFYNDGKYGIYARIPIKSNGTVLNNVQFYRQDFPDVAYLELIGSTEQKSTEISWSGSLVIPPIEWSNSRFGPNFNVINIKLGDYSFPSPYLEITPGLPLRIRLNYEISRAIKALPANDSNFYAELRPLAKSSDPSIPVIKLKDSFSNLQNDISKIYLKTEQMKKDNSNGTCNVYAKDCRDGECG